MEGVGAMVNSPTNPAMGNDVCRTCGACCAALKVGFHESETTRAGGEVPLVMTEPWIPKHVRMRGTAGSPPRCIALEGEIGKTTACSIYGQHPGPCKALEPSTPDKPNPWCDQARIQHGMQPLSQGAASAPASGGRRKAPAAAAPPTPSPEAPRQAPEPTPVPDKKPVEEPPAPKPRVQEPPEEKTPTENPPERPPGQGE